jgi:hypothetical protein
MALKVKESTKHAPIREDLEHAFEFVTQGGGSLKLDECTVTTDDFVRWEDEERRCNTAQDDYFECLYAYIRQES